MMPLRAKLSLQIGFIALLLGLCMPALADPTAVAFNYAPDSRQSVMQDKVFNTPVMVYEIGMDNEPTVVLIHGLEQDGARVWSSLARTLKGKYHVVALDLPGFGMSGKDNKLYAPDSYAAVVQEVINKYSNGRVMLIGHGLGAAVALRYTQLQPDNVSRLILVDAAGMLHRSVYVKFLARLGLAWVANFYPTRDGRYDGLAAWVRDALGWSQAAPVNVSTILSSDQAREKLLQSDPVKIAGLALVLQNFGQTLNEVRTPTLVIWGQNDDMSPLRVGRLIASRLENARLRVLPDSGHRPMSDNPQLFNQIIAEELGRTQDQFKAITEKYRYALTPYVTNSDRVATCEDDDEGPKEFTGEYKRIYIDGCKNVHIHDAHVAELRIEGEASVYVDNSQLRGLGVRIEDSSLIMTGGSIMGVQALITENSELDLAGVQITGQQFAIETDADSNFFYSISRVDSPLFKGWLHGVKTYKDDTKL